MIRGILFDLDGTLADTEPLQWKAYRQALAPFGIDVEQTFTSPPPRYSEASLIKTLESEGIGRPSTYASIINVIQDRGYVEQIDRRFFATPTGEVVTDKLIEAFPQLLDVGYTREMEKELDQIAYHDMDWIVMLEQFYGRYGYELVHRSDGYFFLVPANEAVGKRQLSVAEMIVGQGLALAYLDPRTLEKGALITREELITALEVQGFDALLASLDKQIRFARLWTATEHAAIEDAREGYKQALALHLRSRALARHRHELERELADATERGGEAEVAQLMMLLKENQLEAARLENQEALIDGFGVMSGRVKGPAGGGH